MKAGGLLGFLAGFALSSVGVSLAIYSGNMGTRPLAGLPSLASVEAPLPPAEVDDTDSMVGCWRVEATEEEVLATWYLPCPALPIKAPGPLPLDMPWPSEALVLPAFHKGQPDFARQRIRTTLTADKSTKGIGGLLFLPADKTGQGYYVAAYEADNVAAGWTIGTYGVPPVSVPTPAGRVYLDDGFKTKPIRGPRNIRSAATSSDEAEETAAFPSVESTVPVFEGPSRPRALELD